VTCLEVSGLKFIVLNNNRYSFESVENSYFWLQNPNLVKSNNDLQKNYAELLNRVEKLETNGILSKN